VPGNGPRPGRRTHWLVRQAWPAARPQVADRQRRRGSGGRCAPGGARVHRPPGAARGAGLPRPDPRRRRPGPRRRSPPCGRRRAGHRARRRPGRARARRDRPPARGGRPVPAAATVTAAGILAASAADPGRGAILDVAGIDPDAPYEGRWDDDLALWAARRDSQGLDRCVVSLTAPELAAENLIGAGDLAEITGIAPSTLRAYIARGEADVPLPQAVIGGRSLWARPVAEEWAEQRQRDPDAVDAAVSAPGHYGDPVPAGQAELAATLTRSFLSDLWDYRPFRGRWALRWRTKDHVREVAAALGHEAASYVLRTLIPAEALSVTLRHALLDDLAEAQRSDRAASADVPLRLAGPDDTADEMPPYYGIMPKIAEMLGWLARHRPATAGHVITSVTGEAERRLGIPRHVTEQTIRVALDLDGDLGDTLDEFLARVMTPATDAQNH